MRIHSPWNDRIAEPLSSEHLVQLYRHDAALVAAVALFAGRGIGKGEAVVIVATEAHRRAIAARLQDDGFDVDDLQQWGQLTMIDAARLLARFRVDGRIDPALFRSAIESIVGAARAAGRSERVRVYGEMVNLLWKVDHEGARRLEELWNDAIGTHGVSLLCAYRLDDDDDAEQRFPEDLRGLHGHLIPVAAGT